MGGGGDDEGNTFGTKVDEMNSIGVDFRKVEDSFCYQLIQQKTVQRLHQHPATAATVGTATAITITN